MTNEEKKKYQAFVVQCMKNKTPVKFGNGKYKAKSIIFSLQDRTDEEIFTVLLADLNGCDSLITVGLEEFYKENCDESKTNTESASVAENAD